MIAEALDVELARLEQLWADGLSDAYRAYLEVMADGEAAARSRLSLAAALVEVGIRLQGLGGHAAPPPTLLIGDLCLARSARILADSAPRPVQVAFSRAIEELSAAAASGTAGRPVRDLLVHALRAR